MINGLACADLAHAGPSEERHRRPSQRDPPDPEGGHRDAFLPRSRKGRSLFVFRLKGTYDAEFTICRFLHVDLSLRCL